MGVGSADYDLEMMQNLFKIFDEKGSIEGLLVRGSQDEYDNSYFDLEWVCEPHEEGKISYLYFIHRLSQTCHIIKRGGNPYKDTDYIKILDTKKIKEYL